MTITLVLLFTEACMQHHHPLTARILMLQVESTRWMVEIRSRTLAVLPLSTAGGAVRKAAEGMLNMRSILVEGDLIAVSLLRCIFGASPRPQGVRFPACCSAFSAWCSLAVSGWLSKALAWALLLYPPVFAQTPFCT